MTGNTAGAEREDEGSAEQNVAEAHEDRGQLWHATRALRHRDYRFFFIAALLANFGGWLAGMARGYLTYSMTDSAALLGTVAFCQTIPILLLVPFTGVLVDRFPRKPLLMGSQTVFVFTSAATAILIATGHLQVWHIMALSLLDGLAAAANAPAWQSLTVELVGPDDLMSAIALNSMQFNVGRILGALMSGLLYDLVGPTWCFGLDTVFLMFGLLALWQVRMRPPSAKTMRTGVVMNFVAGIRYMRRHPDMMAIVTMAASVTVFALPFFTLLPVFARTILEGTARTQSYLLVGVGVGSLVAGVFQAMDRNEVGRGRKMLVSQAFLSVCLGVFALSTSLPLSIAALAGCGAGLVGFNTTANTTVQLLVPDHMRGRLMGVFLLAAFGLTPIGSLLVGAVAEWVSAPIALFGGAVICAVLTLVSALRFPNLRAL